MTTDHLETLFSPSSVAIIGATPREGAIGRVVTEQLIAGGFDGPVWPVNPKHESLLDLKVHASVEALPGTPDLAVITTPARTVPGIVEALGRRGCRVAMVLSGGLGRETPLHSEMLQAAAAHRVRVIGPESIGLIRPCKNLNASFAPRMPLSGQLAFLSQSGSIIGGTIDWAHRHEIGFSHVVSLGDQADIGVGDLLDYLATDIESRAVLLYLETIEDAQGFMSAARACARVKPVIALKAGRRNAARRQVASHTGALAGTDALFDAAFARAGIMRINTLEELFDAAEVLDHSGSRRPLRGERLAIVTNGGGAGLMAADAVAKAPSGATGGAGVLADLAPETLEALDAVLPEGWDRQNPVDIQGDAIADRLSAATAAVLEDPGVDAVIAMNCPNALTTGVAMADGLVEAVKAHRKKRIVPKPVFASWLGAGAAGPARAALEKADIPSFPTPAECVRAFGYLVHRKRLLENLSRVPPSLPEGMAPDWAAAREVIGRAAARGARVLNEAEGKAVLVAAGIPTVRTQAVTTPEAAREAAEALAADGIGRFAIKVLSDDLIHKSEVGGVVLDLANPEEVQNAAARMLGHIADIRPDARITGLSVQEMRRVPRAHELICGISDDPVFGPAILFGRGGTAVEVVNDKALGLPPLDITLAEDMIAATRISRLMAGYRHYPPANKRAVATILVRLAELARALPMVTELDINPLLVDEHEAIALDARIGISLGRMEDPVPNPRLSIRPYPVEEEGTMTLRDGREVFCRPVRPEDAPLFEDFFASVDAQDLRLRFFSAMQKVPPAMIASLTQIDYARAMAFLSIDPVDGRMMGVGRLSIDANGDKAEYAVMARSDLQGLGLGRGMMERIIRYGRDIGLSEIWGEVLSENRGMLALCKKLGFESEPVPGEGITHVRLPLSRDTASDSAA